MPASGRHCLGYDFRGRQAVSAIAHRDFDDETQVTRNQLIGGATIAVLAPTPCELKLLFPFEHRETPDLVEIALATFISDDRWCSAGANCYAAKLSFNSHIRRSLMAQTVRNSSGLLNDREGSRASH